MYNLYRYIDRWIEKTVNSYAKDEFERKQGVIVIRACFLTSFFMLVYLCVSYFIDFNTGVTILPFEALLFALLPVLFFFRISLVIIGNLFVLVGYSFGIALVTNSGGLYSPVMPWLTLMPISALLLVNKKWAWIWAVILLLTTLTMGMIWYVRGPYPMSYNKGLDIFFFVNCYAGLIFIYLGLNLVFEYGLNKANESLELKNIQLMAEKEKSERLLLNILPAEIAEELKEKGKADPQLYENVTVLFTDFVNFTAISENLTPRELVEEIHYCFKAIDDIISLNGMEKIKTIGDAYLAVCGLPISDTHHAIRTVKAGIEICEFINKYNLERQAQNKPYFNVRIGIHSGPVVAGIVGLMKFAYDIWGDTVNTAARMEQNCEPGRINISGFTYELVKDKFSCEYRGKIEAKNKGFIEMYYVN